MPKHAALTRDLMITVSGTAWDLGPLCRSIEITDEKDDVEVTSFSGSGYKEYVSAFSDANVTAELFANYDAAGVHSITVSTGADAGATTSAHTLLQGLYNTGGTFAVDVVEARGAVSATNPRANIAVAKLYAYSPVQGAVGDAAVFTCTMRNAGTAGLVWYNS